MQPLETSPALLASQSSAVFLPFIRITSYNVCYTKLLRTALDWLASSAGLVSKGCIGHVPEILDGDFPHQPRGCDAQAWGASEIVRVWKLIESLN